MVDGVLVQYNLVDSQYQHKPKVLYTFMFSKFYAYLLNVFFCSFSRNLVFLKTYNTDDFNYVTITFTDQNGRSLGKEDKVNLALLINK